MSETYPVLINGEKKGTLTVSREGLTTRFDAKCEDPGTLVRLSVYGGGKEGYLGVMTPENGVLTLHRRLTRAALAAFPAEIELAAEAGRNTSAPERRPESGQTPVYKNQPYRAIPMAAWGLPTERMVEKRTIHGVEYAIFALKDGRIL